MSVNKQTTLPAHEPSTILNTPRSFYRAVSIAEGITWTLLITGMLLKYMAGLGSLPVLIGGSIHGFIFITYALTAVLIGINQRWSVAQIAAAVATAIVPYATIPFDKWLVRQGKLEGEWHREVSEDPRDLTWPRRFLRWLLNRPAALVTLFVFGVIIIMSVLLIIGPPGR